MRLNENEADKKKSRDGKEVQRRDVIVEVTWIANDLDEGEVLVDWHYK